MVLQSPRHDFRRARAAAIDESDHGKIVPGALLAGKILLSLALQTPLRVNDQAGVEKEVCNPHRLGEQAARIVTQVENQSLQPAFLRSQLLEGLLHIPVAALLKLGEANISVAFLQRAAADTLHSDRVPHEGKSQEIRDAFPPDRDRHLRSVWTAQPPDRFHQRHILGEIILDFKDLIPGFDTRPVCRSILNR